ncbi:MAG TPA: universal stress protein [Herpetosiphonaceae bacterium]
MNTLVIQMIAGRLDRLNALIEQVRHEQLAAVLVLGNVVELPRSASSTDASSESSYCAALDRLGALGAPIYLIPGEHDPSLATINRLVQAYHGPARIHLVHRTAAALGTTAVVAGFGGRLTEDHESAGVSVHFPAWEAQVAFEHLDAYNELFHTSQHRILLFATPPQAAPSDHQAGKRQGVAWLTSLIHAYQPVIVCCGGSDAGRGVETISGTKLVNPGWLSEGCYALIDLDRLTVQLRRLVEPLPLGESFRSIVVALDGSPHAWRAFELAASLATRADAKLTLVYAWEPVSVVRGQPYLDDAVSERIAAGERLLAAARRLIPQVAVESEVLEGPAAAAIVRVAETHQADLLVMGARGLGPLRSALGSISQRVLHDAPCPVLITREPPQNTALLDLSIAFRQAAH